MPVRIYALAKQLQLDSKVLVDICNKAGITGKGSALASLSDEEVAVLKAHLAGQGKKSDAPAASQPATAGGGKIRREDYIAPGATVPKRVPELAKKPETLPPKKPEKPQTPPAPPQAERKSPA